jgi:hypothetical protein
VLLYSVVARVNDVLVNVAHDSTYVLGFGHRADLDVVERLWASLAVQMTTAAERRLAAASTAAPAWPPRPGGCPSTTAGWPRSPSDCRRPATGR